MEIYSLATSVVPNTGGEFTATVIIAGLGIVLSTLALLIVVFKDKTPKMELASKEPKKDAVMQSILLAQEERWHGRNPECHKCHLSHEGINGTYCGKLHRYVEYGKGDCGVR